LLGFSLIILCLVIAYRDKHPQGQSAPVRDALWVTIDAAWGLVTLVIILGAFSAESSPRPKPVRSPASGPSS
jgi:TRAP-type C4-dicarboxylate transport system permease large subunit